MGKAVKKKKKKEFEKIMHCSCIWSALQFLPCRPNFGSAIFVDQAKLRTKFVGNALQ
jgi:hypothetical protein